MGTTVSIGQAIGSKDKKRVAEGIGNTVILFMGVALVLMTVLLLLTKPIVTVMSTPQEAVMGTISYLTICFIGIPFITAYNIIGAIFRGMGDSKSPMYFIAIACAANIVLDYVFIGGLHLGPAGAALGSTCAQVISVMIFLVMIITIIANQRGLNDAAAVGIVEKIISFLFLILSSMLSTVSALGAQNIGAGKRQRANETLRYAVMITVGFGIIVGIFMQFFASPVVALFTDASDASGAEVVRLGGQYLRGYVWDCMFAGIHFSFSGYFCACGKSGISFLHNIIAITLVRIPGVYLTSTLFPDTLFPMGLATAAGSLLSAIICVVAFTILNRKEKS